MKNSGLLLVGIAAILAVAVASTLVTYTYAVKTKQDRECTQDPGGGPGGEDCPGKSAENNKNREQQECDVIAGSKDKRVEGQFKKEC